MKEATKRAVEPPHASHWRDIRRECERRRGVECRYPFCDCTHTHIAEIKATKARGEAA